MPDGIMAAAAAAAPAATTPAAGATAPATGATTPAAGATAPAAGATSTPAAATPPAAGGFSYDKGALSKHYQLPEKFANAEDPIKALVEGYTNAEKAIPRAPEKYEFTPADDLKKAGFEFAKDDPSLGEFGELAKKHKIPAEAYNDMLNLYGRVVLAGQVDNAKELEKLGADGQQMIGQNIAFINKQVKNADMAKTLINMPRTAEEVRAINELMKSFGDIPLPTAQTAATGKTAAEELAELRTQLPELTRNPEKANPEKANQVRTRIAELLQKNPELKKERDQSFSRVG